MKHLSAILILMLTAWATVSARTAATDSLLSRLDSIVEHRDDYSRDRLERISRLRASLSDSDSSARRATVLVELCAAYTGFQLDSALNAATQLYELRANGARSKARAEAAMILARSLTNAGRPREALRMVDSVASTPDACAYRENLYSLYFTICNELALAENNEPRRRQMKASSDAYRDSLIAMLPAGSVGYTYLSAARLDDIGKTTTAIKILQDANFADNASYQYGLGMMLLKTGRRDEALDAMARASILDITEGKKEYMAIIKLARLLYEEGDIPRAFNYIRCALEDVSFSHAEVRATELIEAVPVIQAAYRSYEEGRMAAARRRTLFVAAIALLTMALLALVWMQLRRLKAVRRQLDHSNQQLAERNRELAKADAVKLRHIDDLLYLHAANIGHLKEYRQTLYRMMSACQYQRVAEKLKTDKLAAAELREFYEKFDATFLSIFPDFISEVNRHLRCPVATDGASLTPELRIIALIKLGITSTPQIAMMLQYSSQTVYNYRSSIRASLITTFDEFERNIGIQSDDKV